MIGRRQVVLTCRSQKCRSRDIASYFYQNGIWTHQGTSRGQERQRSSASGARSQEDHARHRQDPPRSRIVACYDYCDEDGRLLFQTVRYEPKDFKQRRPDGKGGWIWNLDGVRLVPYRLPELLAASQDTWIFYPEGEGDAEALRSLGLAATTNPLGAGKMRDEYAACFAGRKVAIPEDNDAAGIDDAMIKARALLGNATVVKMLHLPGLPPNGDVRDWIASERKAGRSDTEIAASLVRFGEDATPFVDPGAQTVPGLLERSGAELLAANASLDTLPRLPLLGRLTYYVVGWSHILSAYPKTGKGDLLATNMLEWTALGHRVCYLSEEPEDVWKLRVQVIPGDWEPVQVVFGLGASPENLFTRAFSGRESIVILDTPRNLLGLDDERDNSEVARVIGPWIAKARSKGKTFIAAHHARKGGGEHGEGIAGAGAFLGLFDVALELSHDAHHEDRRVIRGLARVITIPDLLYERTEEGVFRALGDPAALGLEEVKTRVLDVLTEEWRTTARVTAALDEPRPSEEQVRQALVELATAKTIERDPPIAEGVKRGKPHRWRIDPERSDGSFNGDSP
jgi:hypothetical protein